MNDVMGGQVPLFFANVASSLGHIQSGRLRPLAVTSKLRSRALPDLPSMEEAGLKGYEVLEWNPVLAPAGVPAAVRQKLAAALRKAMSDPEILGRVRALGGEVFGGNETDTAKYLKDQQALWARVVARAQDHARLSALKCTYGRERAKPAQPHRLGLPYSRL